MCCLYVDPFFSFFLNFIWFTLSVNPQSLLFPSSWKCCHLQLIRQNVLSIISLPISLSTHQEYRCLSFHQELCLYCINPSMVSVIISKLDHYKWCGLVDISVTVLKKYTPEQSPAFFKLYNKCLAASCFSPCWTSSSAVPTFKNSEKLPDSPTWSSGGWHRQPPEDQLTAPSQSHVFIVERLYWINWFNIIILNQNPKKCLCDINGSDLVSRLQIFFQRCNVLPLCRLYKCFWWQLILWVFPFETSTSWI